MASLKKEGGMRKGFTLIELVIVLIIVAVLGTLGLTQYTRLIEKARGAEAKEILGYIRKQAAGYYMERNSMVGLTNAMVSISGTGGVPGPAVSGAGSTTDCAATHYFWYTITGTAPTATTLIATEGRCTAGGKNPNVSAAASLTLTSNFSAGTDIWSGGVYE